METSPIYRSPLCGRRLMWRHLPSEDSAVSLYWSVYLFSRNVRCSLVDRIHIHAGSQEHGSLASMLPELSWTQLPSLSYPFKRDMFTSTLTIFTISCFFFFLGCRQPPHCVPETYTNATSWYKVFTTVRDSDTKYSQDYNPFWCYKGAIGKVYHALNPKLTVIVPDVSCLSCRLFIFFYILAGIFCSAENSGIYLKATFFPPSSPFFNLSKTSAQHFTQLSK